MGIGGIADAALESTAVFLIFLLIRKLYPNVAPAANRTTAAADISIMVLRFAKALASFIFA